MVRCLLTLVLALVTTALPLRADDAARPAPAIMIRSAGLDALLPDDRDAVVRELLRMLPARMAALPAELDAHEVPGPLLGLVASLITHPFALEFDVDETGSVRCQAVCEGAQAARIAADFRRVADMFGLEPMPSSGPVTRYGSGGRHHASIGLIEGEGPARAVVAIGREVGPLYPLPGGVVGEATPFQVSLDVGKLIRMSAADVAALTRAPFDELQHLVIDASYGYAEGARWRVRLTGIPKLTERIGLGQPMPIESLRVVPSDAIAVHAGLLDVPGIVRLIESMAGGEDAFEAIREATGVNVRDDIIGNIGRVHVTYRSISTGGWGLLATVHVTELRDADAFARASGRLGETADRELEDAVDGRVRLRTWERGGRTYTSVVTPGLPIPVELTWTVAGGKLIVGATPWTVDAAASHIEEGSRSILDTRVPGRMLREGGDIVGFAYIDSEVAARAGFPMMTGAVAAMRNFVRMPGDDSAQPLSQPPSWRDFALDVRPLIVTGRREGDSIVIDSQGDGSVLVNATSFMRIVGSDGLAMGSLSAGVLLPALGRARESARVVKSASQVRGLVQAAIVFHQEHDRQPGFAELIEAGYIMEEMLESPFGPAWDLSPDYALRADIPWSATFRSTVPVAIDRAAYLNGGGSVPVGCADGHVKLLVRWEVEELLAVHPEVRDAFGLGGGAGDDWEAGPAPAELPAAREGAAMMRSVMMAFMMHAADEEDRLPAALDDLRPYLDDRTFGFAARATLRLGPGRMAAMTAPSRTLLGIAATEDGIAAGFGDGHVEVLSREALGRLLEAPENAAFR